MRACISTVEHVQDVQRLAQWLGLVQDIRTRTYKNQVAVDRTLVQNTFVLSRLADTPKDDRNIMWLLSS